MSERQDGDLGFAYREGNKGQVTIFRRGRLAVTLRGERAVKFLTAAAQGTDDAQQQLMARWTGNYKQGNERRANDLKAPRPMKNAW